LTSDSRAEATRRGDRHAASLTILAIIAGTTALYFAQEIFIPIALGLMFTALFRPLVRGLESVRIPAPVGATLVVVGCLVLLGTGGVFLARPVRAWVSEAPKTLAAARSKLDKLRRPIKQVSQAVQKAQQEVAGEEQPRPSQGPAQPQASPPSPSPSIPPFVGRIFATTAGILGTLLQTIVIVFLILATGNLFTRKVAAIMPKPARGTAEQAVEKAEAIVRRYLVVTALINLGQAVLVTLAMIFIGIPTPPLWGLLTFAFEFLPYIGALFMVISLTITGLATFESVGHVLLAPLAYMTISTIQNNAVSPFAYGSGLRLNPLAVLFSVVVGWFLWGVAGAFVAVPLLAVIRIFAEHSRTDSRLAAVLSE
jgi:predicted PurR-regulated permease PerM